MSLPRRGHPRVLVISARPINGSTGTGITLRNLLSSIPASQVSQIYLDPGAVDTDVCSAHLALPAKGSHFEHRLRSLRRGVITSSADGPPIFAARSRGSLRAEARAWASAALDIAPIQIGANELSWAAAQSPDIIYSPLGSVRVMRLANHMSKHLGIPILPHFMDDWPNTLFSNHELGGIGSRVMQKELRNVFEKSAMFLGISSPMVNEYESRYKRPGHTFMNCVDDSDFVAPTVRSVTTAPVLAYVGGLHLERWRSLRKLADSLAKVSPTAELRIHAPQPDLDAYAHMRAGRPNIKWGPALTADEVPGVLAQVDVAVHVESLIPSARLYTRLSVSTKLPQYLAAGRPVLALGPPELASMQYVRDAQAGVVLSEYDAEGLKAFLADETTRSEMALHGFRHAERNHARTATSEKFSRVLVEASAGLSI